MTTTVAQGKKPSVGAKDPFSLELFQDSLSPTHEVREECKESESEDSGQKSYEGPNSALSDNDGQRPNSLDGSFG